MTEVVQKQNHRGLCNKYTNVNWKNLPKSVRRLWSFLAVNQSYPSPLNKWTVEQIAQQLVITNNLSTKINYFNSNKLYLLVIV